MIFPNIYCSSPSFEPMSQWLSGYIEILPCVEFEPRSDQARQTEDIKTYSACSFPRAWYLEGLSGMTYDLKNEDPVSQQVCNVKEPSLRLIIGSLGQKLFELLVRSGYLNGKFTCPKKKNL
jgi:hypothetical protein